MIRANVKVCGTVSRDAVRRSGQDGKEFLAFSVKVRLADGSEVEFSVAKDLGNDAVQAIRSGMRIGVSGVLIPKKRKDKVYLNLSATALDYAAGTEDKVEGELEFRGKVGKSIEEKMTRNDKPFVRFSAFSSEKVDGEFEFLWVRFIRFDSEQEDWLQPGVQITGKGPMEISVYAGRLNFSCRANELGLYVKER